MNEWDFISMYMPFLDVRGKRIPKIEAQVAMNFFTFFMALKGCLQRKLCLTKCDAFL